MRRYFQLAKVMWGKGVSETTGGQSGDCEYCLVCALFSLHQSLLSLQSSLKQSHQLIPPLPHAVVAVWCPNGPCIYSYIIIPLYKTLYENRDKTKISSLYFPPFLPTVWSWPSSAGLHRHTGTLVSHRGGFLAGQRIIPLFFHLVSVFLPVTWIYLPCDRWKCCGWRGNSLHLIWFT